MAAAAITANYEIAHNLKSIQLRDPFFSYTHVFKGKECNEAIIWVLRSWQLPQNSKLPSKLAFLDLFTRRYTFVLFVITWIRFIGFRQNLAWTYYLTLGTSLRKNFSFFSKSKMAASGQKLNFDIISAQNSPFGLANGSLSSDLDKIWQADTTQP